MGLQKYKEQLERLLNEKNVVTDVLRTVEQKTGAPRLYVAAGVAVFTIIWLVYGYGAELLCNVIGFVYPAFRSIRALESLNKEDDTKWLTYWVVFALFSLVEFFSDILLSWFPIYWLVKCAFLIWCFAPSPVNGSLFIYDRIIRPFFLKHESAIDAAAEKLKDIAAKQAQHLGDKAD